MSNIEQATRELIETNIRETEALADAIVTMANADPARAASIVETVADVVQSKMAEGHLPEFVSEVLSRGRLTVTYGEQGTS